MKGKTDAEILFEREAAIKSAEKELGEMLRQSAPSFRMFR